MNEVQLHDYLKTNLELVAYREAPYISMGGPQDGDSEPGRIIIELHLEDTMISRTIVENW